MHVARGQYRRNVPRPWSQGVAGGEARRGQRADERAVSCLRSTYRVADAHGALLEVVTAGQAGEEVGLACTQLERHLHRRVRRREEVVAGPRVGGVRSHARNLIVIHVGGLQASLKLVAGAVAACCCCCYVVAAAAVAVLGRGLGGRRGIRSGVQTDSRLQRQCRLAPTRKLPVIKGQCDLIDLRSPL